MTDLNVDGMAVAPGVVETIISIAAKDVDGVAAVGSQSVSGLRRKLAAKPSTQGIEVAPDGEGLRVTIRVDVFYGKPLTEVAAALREAIADAVTSQVGVPVTAVDVYIDGIQFAE